MKYLFTTFCLLLLQQLAFSQNDSVTVYIMLREDCVISQHYTLPLNQLFEDYQSEQIGFMGVFPGGRDLEVDRFREKYKVAFPMKSDYYMSLTKKLGATVTPEIVILDHASDEILYQGRIDNTYFRVGKKRTVTTTSELEDALRAIRDDQPIAIARTKAVGCFISFN